MNWIVLRYTKPDFNQYSTLQLLVGIFGKEAQIIVGHEFSRDNVEHTHSVIGTTQSFDNSRQKFKNALSLTRCKDKEGNKIYSMKKVTDLNGAVQYAIKCNKYAHTEDFHPEALNWAIENPWVFPEKAFEEQYSELDQKFLGYQYDDWEYLQEVLSMYSRHSKGFMLHFIRQRYYKLANIRNGAVYDPWAMGCPRQSFRDNVVYKILQI